MGEENKKRLDLKDSTYAGLITLILSLLGLKEVSPDIVNNIINFIGLIIAGAGGIYLTFKDGLVEHKSPNKEVNPDNIVITSEPDWNIDLVRNESVPVKNK